MKIRTSFPCLASALVFALFPAQPVLANDPFTVTCKKSGCKACEEGSGGNCSSDGNTYTVSKTFKAGEQAAADAFVAQMQGEGYTCEVGEINPAGSGSSSSASSGRSRSPAADATVRARDFAAAVRALSADPAPAPDPDASGPGITAANYRRSVLVFSGVSPDYVKYEMVNGVRLPQQLPIKGATRFYSDLPDGFQITEYPNHRLSAPDANGFRTIPANAVPSAITIYRNPDGGTATTQGRLDMVDKQRHPQTGAWVVRTIRKTAPKGNNNWSTRFFLGDPAENAALAPYREIAITRTPGTGGAESTREITRDRAGDGSLVITSDLTRGWAFYKHGEPAVLTETRHTGMGQDATTTWTYYHNSADRASFNKPATMRQSGGAWSNTTYQGNPVTGILVTKTVSGWLGQPAPAIGSAPDENASRVVVEIEAYHETGTFGREEKIQGATISKTWGGRYKAKDGLLVEKSQVETGTATLTTVATRHPGGAATPAVTRGRLKSVQFPDGTVELHAYAMQGENRVETIDKGAGSLSGVSHGTRTVSTYAQGDVLISEIVTDIASGVELTRRDAIAFDEIGQVTRWAHNANPGDYTETLRDCCGIAATRTRDGITTTYTRDALKRPVSETALGITTGHLYGKITLNGVDFPTETTIRTAGDLSLTLGTTVKDHAGNVIQRITPDLNGDAAPEITTITRDLASRTTTTTYPDGSTEVETDYADGQSQSLAGTAVAPAAWTYATHSEQGGGLLTTTYAGDTTSPRWQKTYQNLAGRILKTTAPGPTGEIALQTLTYDTLGRSVKTTDADGITVLTAYNAEGEAYRTALDLNQNGQIDNSDRITDTHREVLATTPVGPAIRNQQIIYDLSNTPLVTATTWQSVDGLATRTETLGSSGASVSTVQPYPERTDGAWTAATTAPDGTKSVTTYTNWQPTATASLGTANAVIQSQTATYDALRRPVTTADSRTGPVTTTYAASGQVASLNDHGRVTGFAYDTMGRRTTVTLPDNSTTHTSYWPTGQEKATWGSQTNPTVKLYNPQGQLTELRTYRSSNLALAPDETTTGYDATTWTYNPRGQLTQKTYADGKGPTYTYTPGGKLHTRTWARGITTTYGYNSAGELTTTDYSDSTPDVTLTYDKLGRPTNQSNTVASSTYAYNPATLQQTHETLTYDLNNDGTPELTRVLNRSQDTLGRPTGYTLNNGTTPETTATYQYGTTTGRLSTVSDGTNPFTYNYLANSNLLESVTGPAHSITNAYATDRNVLLSKENKVGTNVISKYDYNVNALGQRTAVSQTGTAFSAAAGWAWAYDTLGQVITAEHATTPANNRAYQYDSIGNRQKSANSLTLPTADNYTTNNLNQYTAVGSITPIHDDDGNLTTGSVPTGAATLTWDAENRLVTAIVNGTTVHYTYDSQSRLVARTEGSATTLNLYDRWNRIAEYQLQNSSFNLHTSYLWGPDLSGSMQGAGGVGGLLAVRHSPLPPGEGQGEGQSTVFYPCFDGNGNVSEYLNTSGTVAALFEYDPFGNTVVNTDATGQFPYRFSTKPQDPTTGLLYYGYRFYDPTTGRWPSRDPIAERGGVNLYGFVENDGIGRWDILGRVINSYSGALNHYRHGGGSAQTAGASVIDDVKDESEPKDAVKNEVQSGDPPTCDKSGTLKISGSTGAFQTHSLVIGRVVVNYKGTCKWKCGCCKTGINIAALFGLGTCKCDVECDVDFAFTESYDFTPHASDPWSKRQRDRFYGAIAGAGTPYVITGSWSETVNFKYAKYCAP